jgi:hypothetical protein
LVSRYPTLPAVVLVLILLAGSAPAIPSTHSPARAGDAPTPLYDAVSSAPLQSKTPVGGNFSLFLAGPQHNGPYTTDQPTNLTPAFRFKVENYTTSDLGLLVRVPGTTAVFPVSSGQFKAGRAAQNLNVTGSNWTWSTNVSVPIPLYTTFNESPQAYLTTSQVAVLTGLAWGTITLEFEWEWTLNFPGGGPPISSGWTPERPVVPAQYAQLVSTSPHQMNSGQSFDACLAGPVQGRTFGLEALNGTAPNAIIAEVNSTIEPSAPLPFCWSVLIPPAIGPSTILIHLWDYQAISTPGFTALLLFVVTVFVVNATSAPPSVLGIPLSSVLVGITVVAVVAAIALVAYVSARRLQRRPRRPEPLVPPPSEGPPGP